MIGRGGGQGRESKPGRFKMGKGAPVKGSDERSQPSLILLRKFLRSKAGESEGKEKTSGDSSGQSYSCLFLSSKLK